MPTLIVQKGHCYRHTGATGTAGEQDYATAVASACVRLLNRDGWVVRTTLADENSYRGNAFVAIHCDGSTSPSARGASVGYQTPEGQAFGQAFKVAYAARGWPVFRPDNYTADLHYYYGVSNAVAAGTRRAFIAECGFLTNADDRELLLAPDGPSRVALAIGDALGITAPPTAPRHTDHTEEDEMILYNIGPDGKERWAHVTGKMIMGLTPGEIEDARKQISAGNIAARWVDTATWDAWVSIRDAETTALKHVIAELDTVVALLQQLVAAESTSAKGQP